jgi:hypothetical protein
MSFQQSMNMFGLARGHVNEKNNIIIEIKVSRQNINDISSYTKTT